MTYNVFSGTLNLTQPTHFQWFIKVDHYEGVLCTVFAAVFLVTFTVKIRRSCGFSHDSELWFTIRLGLGLGIDIGCSLQHGLGWSFRQGCSLDLERLGLETFVLERLISVLKI